MKKGKNEQYHCKSIEKLESAFHEINSVVASDTRFMAQALMFIAERVDDLVKHANELAKKPKRTRKVSAWSKFVGKGMKAGKSMPQIAQEWKALKKSKP